MCRSYVQPFPATGGKWQISTDTGGRPRWNAKGDALFYTASNKLMTVSVKTAPQFEAGVPEALFSIRIKSSPDSLYDVHPDGKRFVVSQVLPEEERVPMTLVQNWFASLR